eukprot:TRINITY_DN10617_c0_g1_i1.p1 TRINITY_DN10617_c0_g1~~TRINITY_DN10617_c0_g1_i1.p1  ORF type:complete len:177 (+),score=35.83 TRINITY_DN10617_c0_g1_i1:677-1207(+)
MPTSCRTEAAGRVRVHSVGVPPRTSLRGGTAAMRRREVHKEGAEDRRRSVGCLKTCAEQHKDDVVQGFFCVMDTCSSAVLDCYHDETCRGAAKCMPEAVGECAMPQLDAYLHQELFRNATKCVGLGLEYCGRAAVEMVRDQDIAEAVQCASQCTRTPGTLKALDMEPPPAETLVVV